ncbi:MAG: 4Fe-4S binding protein [Bacillota bacterium]|nr:4Fe-4S binding protein [Bacillota bacterium]
MIERLVIGSLLDETFKKKIDSISNTCLRSRKEKDKCTRCFDICPEKALSLTDQGVYVDPLKCTGCNLCVTACYSRTLKSPDRPYLAFINKALDENLTSFSCTCMENKSKADVNFGCLRTIDPRFLAGIFAADLKAQVFMDFSHCDQCQYKDLGWDTKALIEDFREKAQGENLKISFESFKDKLDEDLSRRDLFKNIFKTTEDLAKSSVRSTSKSLGLDLEREEDLDTLIKILLKKAVKDGKDLGLYLPFVYSLDIEKPCVFCRTCQTFCPSGALKVESNKEADILSFDPDLCNFCGRCLEKCPSNIFTKALLKDFEKKHLYKKEKALCKGCKTNTSDLNEEGYCLACALRRKNRRGNNRR